MLYYIFYFRTKLAGSRYQDSKAYGYIRGISFLPSSKRGRWRRDWAVVALGERAELTALALAVDVGGGQPHHQQHQHRHQRVQDQVELGGGLRGRQARRRGRLRNQRLPPNNFKLFHYLGDGDQPSSLPTAVLWNRNYFLRFQFRLLKSYGSGSGSDF